MDGWNRASLCRTVLLIPFLLVLLPVPAKSDALKDYEIALTKGQYAIEERSFGEAISQLNEALRIKPGDHAAMLALGIAYSRAEEYQKAKEVLQKVAAEDPKNARARYELGVVLAHLKEYGEANRLLATVTALTANEELTDAAKELVDGLESAKKEDHLSIRLAAGMQYDTNVLLEPEAPVAPVGDRADWRAVVSAAASYPFATGPNGGMEAGYQFYQSVHGSLEDYNVQQHNLSASGRYALSSSLLGALRIGYATSYVGGDHYSAGASITPSVSTVLLPDTRTQFFAGWEKRDYWDNRRFPDNSDRTGTSMNAGISHTMMFTKETGVAVEYRYEQDFAKTDNWDAVENRGSVTARSRFGKNTVFASAALADWQYGKNKLPILPDRHDRRWDGMVGFYRDLTRTLRLSVADQYIMNDSNLDPYTYRRNIAGVFVEMRI